MGKVVVGVTGLELCGKTEFCDSLRVELEAQGLSVTILSTEALLDEGLKLFALKPGYRSRLQLRDTLERTFGERVIIGAMRERINAAHADVVIWDGVRTQVNVKELVQNYRAFLCVVETDMETRVRRLCSRVPVTRTPEARRHLENNDRHYPLAQALLRKTRHLRVQNDSETGIQAAIAALVPAILERVKSTH